VVISCDKKFLKNITNRYSVQIRSCRWNNNIKINNRRQTCRKWTHMAWKDSILSSLECSNDSLGWIKQRILCFVSGYVAMYMRSAVFWYFTQRRMVIPDETMGPIGRHETSLRNQQSTLRKIAEESRSQGNSSSAWENATFFKNKMQSKFVH
jgi:hypothetical protein